MQWRKAATPDRSPVTPGWLARACVFGLLALVHACGGEPDGEALPPDASFDGAGEPDGAVPSCTPKTCGQLGAECGSVPDGCGGKVSCGGCADGETCGGGGPNLCGTASCRPKTCPALGASCGYVSDGCSEAIDCGGCPVPETCGGAGKANQCGCTPRTCGQLGASCGNAPDGCGGVVSCGTCPSGQTCGGAGPNRCGSGACAPKTCSQLSVGCGAVSDGCADVVDCGTCEAPQVCGGAGEANQCGCAPRTCVQLGASCGQVDGGCGSLIECGSCPVGTTCGGGGVPNQCGCDCTLPHAQTTCLHGECAIGSCDAGWGDCDGEASNGCEVDLNSDPLHCGTCSTSCDDGNACTVGDGCMAGSCAPGSQTVCNSPPDPLCYEATGTCDPASGSCQYAAKPDGTACGTTTCGDWSSCSWGGECSSTGTRSRTCTDYACSGGTCASSNRPDPGTCTRTVANGTSCSLGYCCSNTCVARNNKSHCGSCGVNCGTQSCVQITGLNQYSCTCSSNAFCQGVGFGSIATCYSASGQMICNCQCPSGTSCTGQCSGGGVCADVTGHNYCHY